MIDDVQNLDNTNFKRRLDDHKEYVLSATKNILSITEDALSQSIMADPEKVFQRLVDIKMQHRADDYYHKLALLLECELIKIVRLQKELYIRQVDGIGQMEGVIDIG